MKSVSKINILSLGDWPGTAQLGGVAELRGEYLHLFLTVDFVYFVYLPPRPNLHYLQYIHIYNIRIRVYVVVWKQQR
jgi:hypothetical protein